MIESEKYLKQSQEQIRKYIYSNGWKSNPHNFEIINKWNRRIWRKHKYEIFTMFEQKADEYIRIKLLEDKLRERYGDKFPNTIKFKIEI